MPSALLREHWSHINGYTIFARVSPWPAGGVPVVLVHGVAVSSRYMAPLAEALAGDHNVAAPDLPGYGDSSRPARTLDIPDLARVLHSWMQVNRIGPAVLLGNSFGCQIAVELAAQNPTSVAGLVLVAPTMDPAALHPLHPILRQARALRHDALSIVAVVGWDLVKMDLPRAMRTYRYALVDPVEQKLPRIDAPALVIRGQHDAVVPRAWAERVAGLLPRGRLATVPAGGHVVHYTRPDAVARIVRPFIAGCAGRSG